MIQERSEVSRPNALFLTRILAGALLMFAVVLARAERVSLTFIDEVGEGHPTGDLRTARLFWDSGGDLSAFSYDFESAPGGEFTLVDFSGRDTLLAGGTLLNLSAPQNPHFRYPYINQPLPEPRRLLFYNNLLFASDPGWVVGDKIAAHYAYGFTAANIEVPEPRWLTGVYGLLGNALGDELDSPFSAFAVISRHVRAYTFGDLLRDDQGTLINNVLYYRMRVGGRSIASATGPLASAIENIRDFNPHPDWDGNILMLETVSGTPTTLGNRNGFLARLGFPLRDVADQGGGRFVEFFALPKDLIGARFRVKIVERSNTDLVEVRFVIADVNGAQVSTTPFLLSGSEQDLKAMADDFLFPLTPEEFDMTQVVDFWLEFFSSAPSIQTMPATQLAIDSVEIEVRQPKVRILPSDYLTKPGQQSTVSWRSADAHRCFGTGMLAGELPLEGTRLVSSPGVYGIECMSDNTQTVLAADSVTVRRALRSVSFSDPTNDTARGLGNGDIVEMTLDIAEDGWYQVTFLANPDAPFGPGPLAGFFRFFNGDGNPYDDANAVLDVSKQGPIDFYVNEQTPRLILSGNSLKLTGWSLGDRIALHTSVFGVPENSIEWSSAFIRSPVGDLDFGLDADSFDGSITAKIAAIPETPIFMDGFE